jgi:hypothetical protein
VVSVAGYLAARGRTWRWQFVGMRLLIGRGPAEWSTERIGARVWRCVRGKVEFYVLVGATGLHVVE